MVGNSYGSDPISKEHPTINVSNSVVNSYPIAVLALTLNLYYW